MRLLASLVSYASDRHVRAAVASLVVLASLAAHAAPSRADETLLIIGNSFTRGVRSELRMLARSGGKSLRITVIAPNGMTLARHAESRTTLDQIQDRSWDYVVMQEQSDGLYEPRYAAARALDAEVAGVGAQAVFMMTWRDRGADLSRYDSLRGVPGGSVGYVPIASELDAVVAPVGWVIREILAEDPAADFWGRDGHHAGNRTKYLAAMVLYATLYRETPVGLRASPRLDPELALHDQLAVERIVLADSASWRFDGL